MSLCHVTTWRVGITGARTRPSTRCNLPSWNTVHTEIYIQQTTKVCIQMRTTYVHIFVIYFFSWEIKQKYFFPGALCRPVLNAHSRRHYWMRQNQPLLLQGCVLSHSWWRPLSSHCQKQLVCSWLQRERCSYLNNTHSRKITVQGLDHKIIIS